MSAPEMTPRAVKGASSPRTKSRTGRRGSGLRERCPTATIRPSNNPPPLRVYPEGR